MNKKYWTNFWKEGHMTTFGSTFEDNYDGDIKYLWVKHFDELPNDSKIHDLAAGAGAIARLAKEHSELKNKNFTITANDVASLNISTNQELKIKLDGIDFMDQTSSDQLKLPDSFVDNIVSQYGFEYSPLERTVSEIIRVLKSSGTFIALVHSEKSELIIESKQMLNFLEVLETKFDYFTLLIRFSELVGDIYSKDDLALLKFNSELESTRMKINGVINDIMEQYSELFNASENMNYIQNLFQNKMLGTKVARLEYTNYIIDQNKCYSERLNEMIDASYTDDKLKVLTLALEPNGTLESKEFIDSKNRNLGLVINFKKLV